MEKDGVSLIISDAIITISHVQEHLDNLMDGLMEYGEFDDEMPMAVEDYDLGSDAYTDCDDYSEYTLMLLRGLRKALQLVAVIETNDPADEVCKDWFDKIVSVVSDAITDISYLCKMHKGKES